MRVSNIIRRATVVVSLLVLLVNPSAALPVSAAAAWYVAPDGADTNHCAQPATPCATINGALGQASAGDTVYVAAGTYTGNGGPVVLLSKNATLSGGWDAAFTHRTGASVVDGHWTGQDLNVSAGVTATVEAFTFEWGSGSEGACIHNQGHLRMVGSTIRFCFATGSIDGAIYNGGTLTLDDSSVTSSTMGSGIINDGVLTLNRTTVSDHHDHGIANRSGSLTLRASRITHNGGIGIRNESGTVTLDASTVSGNLGWGLGGGGIYNGSGTVILSNTTVSGNASISEAAGISMAGNGLLILNNCTVSDNHAWGLAGGISVAAGTVILRNTIVARNTADRGPSDCSGSLTSAGYNLVGSTSGCAFTGAAGDLVDVDPRLGSLIALPGKPGYQPLLPGSPTIDAGNPAGCMDGDGNLLPTDQRGMPRAGRCDIGAYEYTIPGPVTTLYAYAGTPQHAPPLGAFETPLQVAALDAGGARRRPSAVLFIAPASGAGGTFADTGVPLTTAVTDEGGIASAGNPHGQRAAGQLCRHSDRGQQCAHVHLPTGQHRLVRGARRQQRQ